MRVHLLQLSEHVRAAGIRGESGVSARAVCGGGDYTSRCGRDCSIYTERNYYQAPLTKDSMTFATIILYVPRTCCSKIKIKVTCIFFSAQF